jgi:Fe-S-cluster-containing dehydrogenase component
MGMSPTKMTTSVEELHHRRVNVEPRPTGENRLFIDLDVCSSSACDACDVRCSYYYHPGNNGVFSIAELATYFLVCRRCEHPHCVSACPYDALEQQLDKGKLLVRHPMRCVECRSCSHACPYGTIYPELVPLLVHNCDFCLDRRDRSGEPLCVATCKRGALAIRSGKEELGENTFLVGDHLIVHSTHWDRSKA